MNGAPERKPFTLTVALISFGEVDSNVHDRSRFAKMRKDAGDFDASLWTHEKGLNGLPVVHNAHRIQSRTMKIYLQDHQEKRQDGRRKYECRRGLSWDALIAWRHYIAEGPAKQNKLPIRFVSRLHADLREADG
jgi:hypothetical protein